MFLKLVSLLNPVFLSLALFERVGLTENNCSFQAHHIPAHLRVAMFYASVLDVRMCYLSVQISGDGGAQVGLSSRYVVHKGCV